MGALLVVAIKVGGDVRGILTWIGINFVITFVVAGISWQGHVGGFLGGLAIGAILVYAPRGPRRTAVQVPAWPPSRSSWSRRSSPAPPTCPENHKRVVLHRVVHSCGQRLHVAEAAALLVEQARWHLSQSGLTRGGFDTLGRDLVPRSRSLLNHR